MFTVTLLLSYYWEKHLLGRGGDSFALGIINIPHPHLKKAAIEQYQGNIRLQASTVL
jgi:hypothetical protein